VETAVRFYF